jgi:arylformamidase
MKIYDISIPISPNMVVWPGDAPFEILRQAEITKGDAYNLSRLTMSAHAGTHVDAPSHFLADGKNVESLPLSILCGKALVVDFPGVTLITDSELESAGIKRGTERLILKTDNSRIRDGDLGTFKKDFVALAESGAEWIVKHEIKLVGIDYLSIAPFEAPALVHKILLSKDVIVVERLSLASIETGEYELFCLPLLIEGCEGSPARAILVQP